MTCLDSHAERGLDVGCGTGLNFPLLVPAGAADDPAVLVVRPERLLLGAPVGHGLTVAAKVHEVRFAGTHLVMRLQRPDGGELAPGAHVVAAAPADACTVLPDDGTAP